MAKTIKGLGKGFSETHVVWAVAGLFLVFLLMRYNDSMSSKSEGLQQAARTEVWDGASASSKYGASEEVYKPKYQTLQQTPSGGADVTPPSCHAGETAKAEDLLPKGGHPQSPHHHFQQVNFLKAGHHAGINTVGGSLRNANLQVRSEPPNPQTRVSPWGNSTIQPDLMRVPLEIGCGSQ